MKVVNRREFLTAAGSASLALSLDPRAFAARVGGSGVAFVTADHESQVVLVELASGRTVGRIRTAPVPRSIESVHGRTALVAHTEHGLVTLIDAATRRIRAELEGFNAPRYTAVHPTRPLAYVTDSASQEIVAVDVEHGRIVWRTELSGPARHVSVSPGGSTLWTALGTKAERIAVLDIRAPRKPRLVGTIDPPFLAHDVVFAPDGRGIWVTSGSERRIAVYRAGSRKPPRTLPADAPPQHVAFAGGKAFVASGGDGTLKRHRLDGQLVRESRVPVGSYNVTFAYGQLVTPSLGEGTVSLLDRNGRVRSIRRVARAAHDACILVT
jgi:DNA-binding beta-propeller fold protein YncE